MKNFNRFFLAAAIIIVTFTSCTKTMDVVAPSQTPATTSTSASTIADVTASDNFDWSTTKKVNFTFEGHASEEYVLLLQVLDTDGNVIIQKMQKSNDTYNITLNVPANQSTLQINYGADEQTIDCSNGKATVSNN